MGHPDDVWRNAVRARFPAWGGEQGIKALRKTAEQLVVGQEVEGTVIAHAPFGVWSDIGGDFPALIVATFFDLPKQPGWDFRKAYPIGNKIRGRVYVIQFDPPTLGLTRLIGPPQFDGDLAQLRLAVVQHPALGTALGIRESINGQVGHLQAGLAQHQCQLLIVRTSRLQAIGFGMIARRDGPCCEVALALVWDADRSNHHPGGTARILLKSLAWDARQLGYQHFRVSQNTLNPRELEMYSNLNFKREDPVGESRAGSDGWLSKSI